MGSIKNWLLERLDVTERRHIDVEEKNKDQLIKELEKEVNRLRSEKNLNIFNFPKLLANYNPDQMCALAYELINTTRNTDGYRHLLLRIRRRVENAISSSDQRFKAEIYSEPSKK